ncbi:MAG: hypothetical protein FH758_14550 [Firmicutes bacterium]|nr:hypothetical protein [Bacillota bacterium]
MTNRIRLSPPRGHLEDLIRELLENLNFKGFNGDTAGIDSVLARAIFTTQCYTLDFWSLY